MWVPPAFAETDPETIAEMIGAARLATLVSHGPDGLFASPLPILFDAEAGIASGHLARANPHRARDGGGEALLIVHGPEAYVSPNWYPSKARDGRAVPTWNYEAVHLHGLLEWTDEPSVLRDLVDRLSRRHEADKPTPWRLEEAPTDYVEGLLRGIVGVTMRITRVEAKRKLSQTASEENRLGTIAGLEASADPRDRLLAARMRDV